MDTVDVMAIEKIIEYLGALAARPKVVSNRLVTGEPPVLPVELNPL